VHVPLHTRMPDEPHMVVHGCIAPGLHSVVSSVRPSQLSSMPLHASDGGVHVALSVQLVASQRREPVVEQLVVHGAVLFEMHSKPLSGTPSQSSSRPLQVSAGGVHMP
jgi:hypothetical protein